MEALILSENSRNRTNVDIFGHPYVIIGSESTAHIHKVAAMVDEKMREINSKNPFLDMNKLAVLTAVNAVNDYLKMKERVDQLENELKKAKD